MTELAGPDDPALRELICGALRDLDVATRVEIRRGPAHEIYPPVGADREPLANIEDPDWLRCPKRTDLVERREFAVPVGKAFILNRERILDPMTSAAVEGGRMSGVELIAAAMSAGAAAGLTDTASTAVKDAYAGLKAVLRPWIQANVWQTLEADRAGYDVWVARIGEELGGADADPGGDVLEMARRLLALADPSLAAKFNVDASHAKGVQVGNNNVQTNNF
jgi:hypothetical protein